MSFLDGKKSYLGFIGMGILGILTAWKPEMGDIGFVKMAMEALQALAGVGIAHKIAKK